MIKSFSIKNYKSILDHTIELDTPVPEDEDDDGFELHILGDESSKARVRWVEVESPAKAMMQMSKDPHSPCREPGPCRTLH
jgi:hypothetical protein